MRKGLIHIYTGDGKGKTTCAVGLAARAAGHGHKVVFAQFMKAEGGGERAALRALKTVVVMPNPTTVGFIWTLDEIQKAREADLCARALKLAFEAARDAQMLILDEALVALREGILSERALIEYLDGKPEALEVVLTGRGATDELIARADYVSEIACVKHPYSAGVSARAGIEY